jgi:hypothetical protein
MEGVRRDSVSERDRDRLLVVKRILPARTLSRDGRQLLLVLAYLQKIKLLTLAYLQKMKSNHGCYQGRSS